VEALPEHDLATLGALFESWHSKRTHARTLLRAFYERNGDVDLERLSIGKLLQARLNAHRPLVSTQIAARHESADGTIKLLLRLRDGASVESVLMPTFRADVAAGCVSSQVGCAMGCDFCASTRAGLQRNLTAGEIVEQFLHLRRESIASSRRLRTLVFMGMGEPLHNFDNIVGAIQRITHPDMGALGARQITVSTVGIPPKIDELADADLGVHLALSLHAPDDATRAAIVPANRRYPVAEILAAAKRYYSRTRRVVNVEYCLLGGVNDSDDHAHMLAKLLEGFRAHVNLIPYNSIGAGISGRVYLRPPDQRVATFLDILRDQRVVSHVRVTRGDDVAAACGQLRQQHEKTTCPHPSPPHRHPHPPTPCTR
jgi:23S rRNA (adenine2503-C2)-methyltransferase